MISRISFSILLLIGILFLPWWAFLIIGFMGCLVFSAYFEFIALAILYDLVYLLPVTEFLNPQLIHGLIAIGLLFGVEYLKANLLVYN